MIISKTPVRISFFGGGTDYPDYYRENTGSVLSSTIDKYIYIAIYKTNSFADFKYKISYSKQQVCRDISEIEHPVIREVLRHLDIDYGVEIYIMSDLPTGTGVGSSSSFTVGFLHALHTMEGRIRTPKELAEEAVFVEQTLLREHVGVQDQFAAAYGSMNCMEFNADGVFVHPVICSSRRKAELEGNLLMFYTGISRFASEILQEQINKTKSKQLTAELALINNMVKEGMQILSEEERDLTDFGRLLHRGWLMKKSLSSAISNDFIDSIYNQALESGAVGGKLLGAGGGGFLVFYVPQENQFKVRNALRHIAEVNFGFENEGSRIIHTA